MGRSSGGYLRQTGGTADFTYFSARASENRFCMGQEKVEEKSNETTAMPKLLDSLDISDAVVSTDAIGTQTKIATLLQRYYNSINFLNIV
ncbi:hypothetical protein EZS27_018219 [termite gut metagenome]|uniref:Uncharacterized protein n=1 Tax=termite gut metagenome TaxID=433724 RepID=A0A5J4RGU2_9ZZZZ